MRERRKSQTLEANAYQYHRAGLADNEATFNLSPNGGVNTLAPCGGRGINQVPGPDG